jgi:hypothetical protein
MIFIKNLGEKTEKKGIENYSRQKKTVTVPSFLISQQAEKRAASDCSQP